VICLRAYEPHAHGEDCNEEGEKSDDANKTKQRAAFPIRKRIVIYDVVVVDWLLVLKQWKIHRSLYERIRPASFRKMFPSQFLQ